MTIIMGVIFYVVGFILSIICLILVLIPLFKKEGVGLGILGIFCSIYTYIWGWMKSKELNLKNVMLGWTASFVLIIVGAVLTTIGAFNNPRMQKAIQDANMKAEQGQMAPTPP